MIIIEFMRNGIGNYIEVTEENLQEQIEIFTNDFINGIVEYFYVSHNQGMDMAHCFVEFGTYGAIGDFECNEMTEEEIHEEAAQILDEFVIGEGFNIVIVENEEDY